MKRIILSLLLLLLFIAPSCTKRVTIPDSELALIFRDAFLANAYVLNMRVKFDTVQVYQPIFDKYGYSAEDVAYTVGSFSKRKSARLSDVVEQSIKLLEQGEAIYRHETMILDSIEARALRDATKPFYSKDLVEFYSLKDTVNLTIELDSLYPGKYEISFDYLVDSLDNNRSNYRSMSWVVTPGSTQKKGLSSSYLRKRSEASLDRTLTLDTLASRVVIVLAESYEEKRKPHVTFENIKVIHTPPLEVAVDQLFKSKLDVRIFANDFFKLSPTDSLELPSL
ncbi:MAG: DUF4296 domain-containing protein [Rikenellaceae bacterium]